MAAPTREQLNEMSDKDVYVSVYLSQLFLLALGLGLSFVFFSGPKELLASFSHQPSQALVLGFLFALVVVFVNLLLYRWVPRRHVDDGGVNERVCQNMSVWHMCFFCFFVSVTEEWLFRAVLQTALGLPLASLLFALVHFRYVKKPILLVYVLSLSIALGLFFEATSNLGAVITAHFFINFLFGLILKKRGRFHE
ncbi:CPBP family intramembrane glutamic endopeptidase [Shouchella shacheensis]|uniref:CPBP family intramembrane glutamic endopeptidase n=1 Tax=Shouchella shacheensis TaxID=1649580 RepID=UPI00073FB637|nr:CPBP family intramembrane glutamic endopeptidase [Shouchella shacheensis]